MGSSSPLTTIKVAGRRGMPHECASSAWAATHLRAQRRRRRVKRLPPQHCSAAERAVADASLRDEARARVGDLAVKHAATERHVAMLLFGRNPQRPCVR
eukprot:7322346-Prymnesium_polylepis.1